MRILVCLETSDGLKIWFIIPITFTKFAAFIFNRIHLLEFKPVSSPDTVTATSVCNIQSILFCLTNKLSILFESFAAVRQSIIILFVVEVSEKLVVIRTVVLSPALKYWKETVMPTEPILWLGKGDGSRWTTSSSKAELCYWSGVVTWHSNRKMSQGNRKTHHIIKKCKIGKCTLWSTLTFQRCLSRHIT
jgi:hypothetical protein